MELNITLNTLIKPVGWLVTLWGRSATHSQEAIVMG